MIERMKSIQLPQLIRKHPFGAPQLPKRRIWNASAVKLFKSCKRKWYWKYVMGLDPKGTPGPLVLGSMFHDSIATWMTTKKCDMRELAESHRKNAEKKLMASADYYDEEDLNKHLWQVQTMVGTLVAYANLYKADKKHWRVLGTEIPFTLNMGNFDYVGTVDGLIFHEEEKCHKVWEHKTIARMTNGYMERLRLDTQVRGYLLAAESITGKKVRRVCYDVVKKSMLRRKKTETVKAFADRVADDYGSRPNFYFIQEQLRFDTTELDMLRQELLMMDLEFQAAIKNGDGLDPRTWLTNDCQCNYYRACQYLPLCTVGLDRVTSVRYNQSFQQLTKYGGLAEEEQE